MYIFPGLKILFGSKLLLIFSLILYLIVSIVKISAEAFRSSSILIKVEEDLKASADIFTIDPIKYKISEKIKRSFDPKRIFNPGKMYTGI